MRIQTIRDSYPQLADSYEKIFKSATGSYDIYALFVEKTISLIKENGIVNFIMPVKWTNASFGKGLRTILTTEKFIDKIINFGSYQVFDASTYTGLQWFKKDCDTLQYMELEEEFKTNEQLGKFLNSITNSNFHKIQATDLTADAWTLSNSQVMSILEKLNKQPRRLGDVFDRIFTGLQTSKDDVYFLYACKIEENYVIGFSRQTKETVKIEKELTKPLLKGEDVHRYETVKTDRVVIFPYRTENNEAILYSENEIKEKFPLGYSYLKRNEEILRGREKGRLALDCFWYRYIYPKNLLLFDNKKLIAPEISRGGNFSIDEKGEFYSTTTIYGYIKKTHVKESYKSLLAILNSNLMWWFLVNTGTTLANGYFRFMPSYLKSFPLPILTTETENTLTELVDKILKIKQLNKPSNTVELENKINEIIYDLYVLTNKEIEIIEKCKVS
jgi:hypothetical protein